MSRVVDNSGEKSLTCGFDVFSVLHSMEMLFFHAAVSSLITLRDYACSLFHSMINNDD